MTVSKCETPAASIWSEQQAEKGKGNGRNSFGMGERREGESKMEKDSDAG